MDEQSGAMLLTRCPGCATTFRVSSEQLGMAGGRVRCGACERVFHAVEYRVEEPHEETTGPFDDINQDYITRLLSDAPAPEAPPPDAGFPVPATPPPLPAIDIGLPALADTRPAWQRYGWTAGVLFATLLLGLQWAWLERARLSQDLRYRPFYEKGCALLGCAVPPFRDPGMIRSESLLIRAAPERPGTLLVDAVFTNDSAYAQPWPALEIRFTDMNGKLVAARVFTPAQYLAHAGGAPQTFASRTSQRAHLEILDPGDHAVNYEMRLHEPPLETK